MLIVFEKIERLKVVELGCLALDAHGIYIKGSRLLKDLDFMLVVFVEKQEFITW